MQILLNVTNDLGMSEPKELLIESDQIRSAEVFKAMNGLSKSFTLLTLCNPETFLSDVEDGELRLIVEHQYFYVFETPSEINALSRGVKINTDYSKLTQKPSKE
ncbi:MAG: hypothetical protein HAW67_01285 [Endozoicomonadaceae bacterium]|nr:hypothetical protein [Endozoicomonadaceae bacterium]